MQEKVVGLDDFALRLEGVGERGVEKKKGSHCIFAHIRGAYLGQAVCAAREVELELALHVAVCDDVVWEDMVCVLR